LLSCLLIRTVRIRLEMGSEERKLQGSRATTEVASDVDETAMSLESHGDNTIERGDAGITNSRSLAGTDDEVRISSKRL
jgi:hypothetical protein